MAYTATTWTDGSTPVSASNMNKIEQGIADATNDVTSVTISQPDELPDGATVSSTWQVAAYKYGNLVELRMNVNLKLETLGTAYTIFTLPEGYRPRGGYAVMNSYASQVGDFYLVSIQTSGNVNVYRTSASNASGSNQWGLRQCITFMAAD